MRTGIVLASIVVWAKSDKVTFATWNALSIPKCNQKATGFPYMTHAALKLHNSIECDADNKLMKYFVEDRKYTLISESGDKIVEAPAAKEMTTCRSSWISGAVEALFKAHHIDILVIQEIDYLLWHGLDKELLKAGGNSTPTFGMIPLEPEVVKAGEEPTETVAWLKKEGEKTFGNPSGDKPFVIWNTKKIKKGVKCEASGASGVGKCTFELHGTQIAFLGMHAGGNNGFNEQEAALVRPGEQIDVVLGDFNLHNLNNVKKSVTAINHDLTVPTSGAGDTLYRFVHPARKLFQAFDNYWVKGRTNGATTTPFKCADIFNNDNKKNLAIFIKKEQPAEGADIIFDKNEEKQITAFKALCAGHLEMLKPSKNKSDISKKEDKLVGELKALGQVRPIKDTFPEGFDWTLFAETLGLSDSLELSPDASKYVSMEHKQEDYIAYNGKKFKMDGGLIIHDGHKLSKILLRNNLRGYLPFCSKLSKDMEHFPIKDLPSDHLPVVVHLQLIPEGKSNTRSLSQASSSRAVRNVLRSVMKAITSSSRRAPIEKHSTPSIIASNK